MRGQVIVAVALVIAIAITLMLAAYYNLVVMPAVMPKSMYKAYRYAYSDVVNFVANNLDMYALQTARALSSSVEDLGLYAPTRQEDFFISRVEGLVGKYGESIAESLLPMQSVARDLEVEYEARGFNGTLSAYPLGEEPTYDHKVSDLLGTRIALGCDYYAILYVRSAYDLEGYAVGFKLDLIESRLPGEWVSEVAEEVTLGGYTLFFFLFDRAAFDSGRYDRILTPIQYWIESNVCPRCWAWLYFEELSRGITELILCGVKRPTVVGSDYAIAYYVNVGGSVHAYTAFVSRGFVDNPNGMFLLFIDDLRTMGRKAVRLTGSATGGIASCDVEEDELEVCWRDGTSWWEFRLYEDVQLNLGQGYGYSVEVKVRGDHYNTLFLALYGARAYAFRGVGKNWAGENLIITIGSAPNCDILFERLNASLTKYRDVVESNRVPFMCGFTEWELAVGFRVEKELVGSPDRAEVEYIVVRKLVEPEPSVMPGPYVSSSRKEVVSLPSSSLFSKLSGLFDLNVVGITGLNITTFYNYTAAVIESKSALYPNLSLIHI